MSRYERLNADDAINLPIETRRGRIIVNEDIDLDNSNIQSNTTFPHIESQSRVHCQKKSQKVVNLAFSNLALISLFLTLSICLTFYQKWVLKVSHHYFLLVTTHQAFYQFKAGKLDNYDNDNSKSRELCLRGVKFVLFSVLVLVGELNQRVRAEKVVWLPRFMNEYILMYMHTLLFLCITVICTICFVASCNIAPPKIS